MTKFLFYSVAFAMTFAGQVSAQVNNAPNKICIDDVCSVIETFESAELTDAPILLVALHGDYPFGRPSYHYRFAKRIAQESNNVIAVGITRPGYTDDFNRQSDGVRGETVGDNYDAGRISQIADVIRKLKEIHGTHYTVLTGHSGGAAITAKLTSSFPDLADEAFVISCPCNINAWRADMYERQQYQGFKGDIDVRSPVDMANDVSDHMQTHIFVGDRDSNTQPYLSEQYYQRLLAAGKRAELTVIEGRHEIFQAESVVEAVKKAVAEYGN